MNDTKSKARTVNATIGKQPNIGPFPADQLIPWVVIFGLSYYLFHGFLRLNWVWTLALAIWGMSTWWVLTANGAWRILSKFLATPNWTRVRVLYQPILQPSARKKGRKQKDRSRT
ncbi:MAG: hypothetical protein KME59_25340 [Trichormus sp. ATA11-4-KO1]|jgi:hypothetical protein|nr:hypothetical protein [Trichormus sp. ATA11-4-KO1]